MSGAVKHQPATPLPWVVVKDGAYTVIDSVPPNAKRFGVVRYIGEPTAQNAAYIVHAANAYPKLIEALRVQAKLNGVPSAILRELGEAQ